MKIFRNTCVLILLFAAGTCHTKTVLKTTKNRSHTKSSGIRLTYSKDLKKYEKLIHTISKRHGVSPVLVKAVIQTESNFDHRAVSPAGAMGLMQLMPDTAARFGVASAFDPAQNIDGGVRYLKYLIRLFDGNMRLAIAAYNAGENRVIRMKQIPKFVETQNYVRKVLALYQGRTTYTPYVI